jgi:Putative lumazine-binding
MTNQSGVDDLLRAVRQYFDPMYDSDVSRLDRVFWPTAQLHGLRDGKMR